MTNKYKTGDYIIWLFDVHGTKQETLNATSLLEAMKIGRQQTEKPPHASFIVMRTIHNSLDTAYPWENGQ
jgi:hypothetical protein